MAIDIQHARDFVKRHLARHSPETLKAQLAPKPSARPRRFPGGVTHTPQRLESRWRSLKVPEEVRASILDPHTATRVAAYAQPIENFVGTIKVPLGIAGPMRVNGLFAQGDFAIPLATSEAALVASYHRGACLLSDSGGCTAMLVSEGVTRTPGFAFRRVVEAGEFALWATQNLEAFQEAAQKTTRFGKLTDVRLTIEGNHVYLHFTYYTGGAAGQNMVTIATEAVCRHILDHTPIQPEYWFVEANLSGDKKASAVSFNTVRGKKVTAEACLSRDLIQRYLHTTPERMEQCWRMSALGAVMGGTIGVQGHYANGLAAFYLACGQDVACVAESAIGITRMEVTPGGELYTSVTLPNIILGTVGGGTHLPSQRGCLEILGLTTGEDAPALAEVCASLALAGELSIIGALSAQEFTRAHARLARDKKPRAE